MLATGIVTEGNSSNSLSYPENELDCTMESISLGNVYLKLSEW